MVRPDAANEPAALNETSSPTAGDAGANVNVGVGDPGARTISTGSRCRSTVDVTALVKFVPMGVAPMVTHGPLKVGDPGARTISTGSRCMSTVDVTALVKFVPMGVAPMVTHGPLKVGVPKTPQVPLMAPLGGAGGGVNVTVAWPLELVVTCRADSVPKSVTSPPTSVSMRTGTFASGCPVGPIAVTVIVDVLVPFWVIVSGEAVSVIVFARPEGPVSSGLSVLWTTQPAMATPAASAMARVT